MTAHRIRPQTTIPTANAAIHDPCQRVRVTLPCLVTGGSMPRRVNALDVQPVVASSTATATATRGTQRAAERRTGRPRPRRGGALRLRLTGSLPNKGDCRPNQAGDLYVLQPVVETVPRSIGASPGTPAESGGRRPPSAYPGPGLGIARRNHAGKPARAGQE